MSTEQDLKLLTLSEKKVLWWKRKGLKYEEIADKLGYSLEWVQLQMSGVYLKLGIDKKLHWKKRIEFLKSEVYPFIPDNLDEWLIEVDEVQEIEEPEEILAIVLSDQKEEEKSLVVDSSKTITFIPKPNPVVQGLRLLIISALLLAVICVVGYFAFRIGQRDNPTSPVITAESPQSPTLSPTLSISPTPSLEATIIPTQTLNPNDFIDDFSDGLDPAWIVVYGKPAAVNEQLTASESTMLFIGDSSWTDYQIEFDVKIPGDACNIGNVSNALGVRATDRDNMLFYLFAWCEAEWKYLADGKETAVPNSHTSGFKEHHVTIRVEGNKISVHRNSELVISFIDNDYKAGNIYLRIRPQTLYDNFKITLIQ